jgi:hypothetical protein
LQLALECIAVDHERQPSTQRDRAIRTAEQVAGQCDGFADATAQVQMKCADQSDAHHARPRNTPRDTTGSRPYFCYAMMSDQVVRPLDRRIYGK